MNWASKLVSADRLGSGQRWLVFLHRLRVAVLGGLMIEGMATTAPSRLFGVPRILVVAEGGRAVFDRLIL